MDEQFIQNLIDTLLRIYPPDPTPQEDFEVIEHELGVRLPTDLRRLGTVYAGGAVGGIPHYDFTLEHPEESVTQHTLRLRAAINLPDRYVVLSEPPASLVVLDTRADAAGASRVIWLSQVDAQRLSTGEAFLAKSVIYPSYADFFAEMLAGEEGNHS